MIFCVSACRERWGSYRLCRVRRQLPSVSGGIAMGWKPPGNDACGCTLQAPTKTSTRSTLGSTCDLDMVVSRAPRTPNPSSGSGRRFFLGCTAYCTKYRRSCVRTSTAVDSLRAKAVSLSLSLSPRGVLVLWVWGAQYFTTFGDECNNFSDLHQGRSGCLL